MKVKKEYFLEMFFKVIFKDYEDQVYLNSKN